MSLSTRQDLATLVSSTTDKDIVIYLYADWCGPCKTIGPTVDECMRKAVSKGHLCLKLNVDRCSDLFSFLRSSRRIIQGIPAILYYNVENTSIYPDELFTGADCDNLLQFFETFVYT
tara:strand:+ start:1111 stop:1461 length:351 start_codon:yes stop_codon:yes gene_type:complete